ncbi:MAG: DUF934 domain-containing protein [Betaproteobacteria bacterium]|nr:MAG: DUF934 domain-containing protein [Betaproteobacteria bacterium]
MSKARCCVSSRPTTRRRWPSAWRAWRGWRCISRSSATAAARAVGHITRDHLFFLESCGFDAFELRAGEDPHAALAGFADFSESYQASVKRPLPLFRRRLA